MPRVSFGPTRQASSNALHPTSALGNARHNHLSDVRRVHVATAYIAHRGCPASARESAAASTALLRIESYRLRPIHRSACRSTCTVVRPSCQWTSGGVDALYR